MTKKSLLSNIFLMAVCLLLVVPADLRATWYGENVANGSDVMMMDVCWPFWPESTYSAIWNFGTNPTGIGGYGGFANGIPSVPPDHRPNLDPAVQAAFHPGSVWSFWGGNKDGEPVRVVASSEYTYPRQYVVEGASGSLGGYGWPFMKNGEWYTMMMKIWEPVGVTNDQYSYIGRWIKDIATGKWYLYGIVRLPVPGTSFNSNNGFLEDIGNSGRSVRSLYRRLGYCRKDGTWRSSNKVTINVDPKNGQFDNYWVVEVKPEGDHEILAMELSWNKALMPFKLSGAPLAFKSKNEFTVKQPAAPSLDKPQVASVSAESNGRQVLVKWELAATSSPQFLYRIEVFNNVACQGVPLVVRQERMPIVNTVLLDAVVAKPTVRFTLTDVFDQAITPMVVAVKAAAKPSPSTTATMATGLGYELLHKFKGNDRLLLKDFGGGELFQKGIARGFDTSLASALGKRYAFRFKGFLRAPADGLYVLRMQGTDGYSIAVDGKETLVWDGPHGPAERSGFMNLAKGDHSLAVDYFVDQASSPFFKMEWEGPGLARQEIPVSALMHQDAGQTPVATLTTFGGNNGTATLKVDVNPRGHAIAKLQLFLGTMQIAESTGAALAYSGPMLEGTNTLWTRVTYDGNCTMDSQPQNLVVKGTPIQGGWTMSVVGESKAVKGLWQTAPDAFSFIGEGEYVVTRRITGDFTLTCRLDFWSGEKGERVNGWSWVGLTAREKGKERWWGQEFGIYQMAQCGLRTTPDFSDQGASRISSYALPKGHPWLRMVRRGQVWTAWSSADGEIWELGATHLKPASEGMDAGLVFRVLPQDAQAYFQAKVSCLKLEAGVAKDSVFPGSVPATHTDGPRWTGVVMARSDANIVVLRSSEKGLLRSSDDGKSWSSANGNLSGAANAVRSVAIHPKDPQIMYRAAGWVGDSGAWEGGLWKSTDAGLNWKKLDFPGDFDGVGPSALCGEVVAFDPEKPETVYAGCETKGLYRSEDGGVKWTKLGIENERITAVVLCGWIRGENGLPRIHAVTCPDALMTLLGRGKPALAASVKTAHDYVSLNGGKSLWPVGEWSEVGYLNVAFDKGSADEPSYATTHGFCMSLKNRYMFLFPAAKNMETLRPVTAVASSGRGDTRCGRALLQALNPVKSGRLSRSDEYGLKWNWIETRGDIPQGGYIAFSGEYVKGEHWWLLATDGLYRSKDGGKTLTKVMGER
jgi:hypothetical protein